MECGNARIMFHQKNWKTLRKDIKSFNMIEGGYLTNMGAIRRGLEIIWDKKQFLLHPPPSNLNSDWSQNMYYIKYFLNDKPVSSTSVNFLSQ